MRTPRLATVSAIALLTALPAPAQDEDGGGMVQRFLQDNLSAAGRDVQIRGFEGLLSGEARMAELTVADDQGVWLTLRDAVLDWNRAALLLGNLSVEELSARELIVTRIPESEPQTGTQPPKAEATGFSLPELPVSIRIDKLAIERTEIGEAVFGHEAALTLDGSVRLADGEGAVDIRTERLDGPEDYISLQGGFVNETRVLSLDLGLQEDAGGLVSSLLNLPGAPSIALDVEGEGPLSDFAAAINLSTDGEARIAGDVTLKGDDDGGTAFSADIGGDVTPLLPDDFHTFFGDDVRLATQGTRSADGTLELTSLSLQSGSLNLDGRVSIGTEGIPTAFGLEGDLSHDSGTAVRLPIAGAPRQVQSITLSASYDAQSGDAWSLDANIAELSGADLGANDITLTADGTISQGEAPSVSADIRFEAEGIALADAALSDAIGDKVSGETTLTWQKGGNLDVTGLSLAGADYGLDATGETRIAERSLVVNGEARVRADDLSRFSALSGQELTGQASLNIDGEADILGGQFDARLEVAGDGLSIGQETVDRLLTEPVQITADATRDTEGTVLDLFELRSRAINADASGRVGGGSSDISFDAALDDVSLVLPDHQGALTLSGTAREASPGDWLVGLDLTGPYDLSGNVSGSVNPGESDLTLDLSLPEIAPIVPGHSGALSVAGKASEETAGIWRVDLDLAGPYELTSNVDGVVSDGGTDVALDLTLPDVAALAPGFVGPVALTGTTKQTEDGGWSFALAGTGPYDASVDLDGAIGSGPSEVTFAADLPDLSTIVPAIEGPISARGTAKDAGDGNWQVDFDSTGPLDATSRVEGTIGASGSSVTLDATLPDIAPLVPQLTGPVTAAANAAQDENGAWKIDADLTGPFDGTAKATATLAGEDTNVALTLDVPDIAALVPGQTGAVNAEVTASQKAGSDWIVDADVAGPYASAVKADARIGAESMDIALTLGMPDIAPLAPGYSGALNGEANATRDGNNPWQFSTNLSGPYGSAVNAEGAYGDTGADIAFDASLADIAPFASGLTGAASVSGTAKQDENALWDVDVSASGPYNGTAKVAGRVGAEQTAVDLVVSLPSIAPFAPGVSGGIEARGSVSQVANGLELNLTTQGPESASTAIQGTIATDFSTMNVNASGAAPLGLANRILAPRAIQGNAQFDLTMNGAPSLQALSGTLSINGASLSLPTLQQSLDNIGLQANLNGETLQIDASASAEAGGTVGARGSLQLSSGLNADIEANLNGFVLTDPLLYRTSLDGSVRVAGPLAGNANITGRVRVGRTEIRVPEGGLGFGGAVPNMTHINEPTNVHLTRQRAGLVEDTGGAQSSPAASGGGGPNYGLDLLIEAPEQIFIRGRGLDVEMGGAVLITGTTTNLNPVGEIEVIRGRLDILGKRLVMERGDISLAGGLLPYLDLVASSRQTDLEFLARISGPIDNPKFDLDSVPELPEDEVLSHFLFGKSVTDLSPLQAVQLAGAVASLSGRGGPGLLGNLREGFGLDDLDLATNSEGETEVRAGKYLSDNVYTEFVADSDGGSEIDLNINVTRQFTIKGTTGSKGESSIGVYFERDY